MGGRRITRPFPFPASNSALAEGGDHSVGELAAAAGVTQPTISRHLGDLRRMGLVTAEQCGQDKRFSLHPRVRSSDGMLNLGRRVRIAFHPGECWGE